MAGVAFVAADFGGSDGFAVGAELDGGVWVVLDVWGGVVGVV